jgi:hypothetical protein
LLKYTIHLNAPYYDYSKNESQKNIKIEQDKLNNKALKEFTDQISKIDGIKILDEEYIGQTMTKAVIIEIEEKKLDDMLNQLRKLKTVDIIEPDKYKGA